MDFVNWVFRVSNDGLHPRSPDGGTGLLHKVDGHLPRRNLQEDTQGLSGVIVLLISILVIAAGVFLVVCWIHIQLK